MIEQKYALYEQLLREWNDKMNLVAPSTLDDIRGRHILDSAQLAAHIPQGKIVIDLGSGAGFPAVVLAILGFEVIAIESIAKKCRFLEAVKSNLVLANLTIINDRVETAIKTIPALNLPIKFSSSRRRPGSMYEKDARSATFTARAFAPLIRIFDWTAAAKIPYALLKGENVKSEIAEAETKYKFDHQLAPSSTGPGFILTAENLRPK